MVYSLRTHRAKLSLFDGRWIFAENHGIKNRTTFPGAKQCNQRDDTRFRSETHQFCGPEPDAKKKRPPSWWPFRIVLYVRLLRVMVSAAMPKAVSAAVTKAVSAAMPKAMSEPVSATMPKAVSAAMPEAVSGTVPEAVTHSMTTAAKVDASATAAKVDAPAVTAEVDSKALTANHSARFFAGGCRFDRQIQSLYACHFVPLQV